MENEGKAASVPQVSCGCAAFRSRTRQLVTGLIILVCGIAIGAGGVTLCRHRGGGHLMGAGGQNPGDAPRLAETMARRYGWDEGEAGRVTEIFRQRMSRMQALRAEMRPRFEEEYDRLCVEMKGALREPCFTAWNEDFSRLRRHYVSGEGCPPSGPRGGIQAGSPACPLLPPSP